MRASNEHILILYLLYRGSRQTVLHCAHRATTALSWGLCEQEGWQGLPLPTSLLGEWPRLPSTARIGRAQFHRARSASKEGTWLPPLHPSEAARCASTGPTWVSFQSFLSWDSASPETILAVLPLDTRLCTLFPLRVRAEDTAGDLCGGSGPHRRIPRGKEGSCSCGIISLVRYTQIQDTPSLTTLLIEGHQASSLG